MIILHPAHPNFRWVFLFFLCFLTFGSYWCYDIPSALKTPLEKRLNISDTEFGLFYGVYNFMNIGIVLLGGFFIDRIGLRIGAFLFCGFIALGQLVLSIGVSLEDPKTAFGIMLFGRIIFSIGGESLSVAQSTFCSKWFKGKDLALSFGITLSFARVGSFANLLTTPRIEASAGIPVAVWFGTITCLISLGMTFLASMSDRIRDNHVKTEKITAATPFHIRDVLLFPPSLWLIYAICVFYYVGVFTLISISGQSYLMAEFGFSYENAGTVLSIPYMMSAVLAPILGFAVGKFGWKPLMLLLCSVILAVAYVVLLWAPYSAVWFPFGITMYSSPLIAMVLIGFSYSLCAASLWPCVPLLVDEHVVGTAYGIMNSIQNAGLAIASVLVGLLTCPPPPQGVRPTRDCTVHPLYLLAAVGGLNAICCVLLLVYDLTHGRKLTNKFQQAPVSGPTERDPLLNETDPLLKRVV